MIIYHKHKVNGLITALILASGIATSCSFENKDTKFYQLQKTVHQGSYYGVVGGIDGEGRNIRCVDVNGEPIELGGFYPQYAGVQADDSLAKPPCSKYLYIYRKDSITGAYYLWKKDTDGERYSHKEFCE